MIYSLILKNGNSEILNPLADQIFCEEYKIISYENDLGDIKIQFVDQSDRFNYICDNHLEDIFKSGRYDYNNEEIILDMDFT